MRTFFFIYLFFIFPSFAQVDSLSNERKKRPIRLSEQVEIFNFKDIKNKDEKALLEKSERVVAYLRSLDKKEVVPFLKKRLEKSPFRGIFERYPILYTFLAEEFTHEKALPQLFKLAFKKKLLVLYAVFFILTILLGVYLKNAQDEEESFILGLMKRVLILFTLRVAVFLAFFYQEVVPTLGVLYKVFI